MNKLQKINNDILEELKNRRKALIDNSYTFNNVGELKSIKEFDKIVQDEIRAYGAAEQFDFDRISNILTSMGLDAESGQVVEYVENSFSSKQLTHLIFIGLAHPWKDVRWQILEMLYRHEIENNNIIIFFSLKDENHTYVLRVGLRILSYLDKNLSKVIAYEHLKSEDNYLRILAKKITDLP